MIDWAGRIDALMAHLAMEYRMEDRGAVEILLSALLKCPNMPGSWVILETNWHARYWESAWFALGGTWKPESFSAMRHRQPWRMIIDHVNHELNDIPNSSKLWYETDWSRYPHLWLVPNLVEVVDQTVRVRSFLTRSGTPLLSLGLDRLAARQATLREFVRQIVEDPAQARPLQVARFQEPPLFLYHLELLQRLSPFYRDWDLVVKAFAALAIRHAHLYGRQEMNEDDWQILRRAVADSVPVWIKLAIQALLERPMVANKLQLLMGLFESSSRSKHGAGSELNRLRKNDLIHFTSGKMKWELNPKYRADLDLVVNGRAFTQVPKTQTAR